jgi:hypothetical protein
MSKEYALTSPVLTDSGVFTCFMLDGAGTTRAIISRCGSVTGGTISNYETLPPHMLASVAFAFHRAQRMLGKLSPAACMASFVRGHVVPPDASLPLPPARKLRGKGQA